MTSAADIAFAAFQRAGDPQQLAAVFDATAPELLRVARYLARDAHAADDLLQATFLAAIERRDRYDAARPVLPWLLGILANAARTERRRAGRVPPARSGDGAGAVQRSAAEHAADTERDARLRDTVRGIPQPYREVLLLQLEHGLDTGQIAEVTGRKAATVRTQLARGLELLRGALPVGAGALGATVLPASAAGAATAAPAAAPALAAVRAVVLQRAAEAVTAIAPVPAVVLGGVAMKKMLAVSGAVLAALLGSWFVLRAGEAPSPTVAEVAAPQRGVAAAPAGVGATATAADGVRAAPEAAPSSSTATLRVRVRFEDGTAAAGIGVYVASERSRPFGHEGSADADGVVRFDDVAPGSVQVEPDRGPAVPFTVVAGANELELRLPAGADVFGRVTDTRGKSPIPRATIFALSREHHDQAQRVAQAGEDGTFALRGVATGTHLFARAPGWQPSDAKRESVPAGAKSPLQVELRMGAPGHSLRGRVTTAVGTPAAFALVAIAFDEHARRFPGGLRERPTGMQRQRDVDAFLLRADANGDYASEEVPEGEALVLARPAAGQAPGVALVPVVVAAAADNRCDVVLQPGAQLVGTVRDETGAPFAGLSLLAEWKGTDRIRFEGALEHLLACVVTATAADGSYRLPAMLAGDHDVLPQAWLGSDVRIERHGDQRERVTLVGAETRRLDLVVPRRGDLAVRLVGPDGAPLAGWGVWASEDKAPTPRMQQLEAQRTGADGRVRLAAQLRDRPLHVSVFAPRPREAGDRLVDRYASRQWQGVRVRDDELVLQLSAAELPTGALTARIVDEHRAPHAARLVLLVREGWAEHRKLEPRDGVVAADALPGGRYWLCVTADGAPMLGPFEIVAGRRCDAGDLVVPAPGTLRVVLRAPDGAPIGDAHGSLRAAVPLGGPLQRESSLRPGDGGLVSDPLAAGRYRLWISGADMAPRVQDVELRAREETSVRLDVSRGFRQRFVVATDLPVAPDERGGWVVDFVMFPSDDVSVVHRGRMPALSFELPMAKGTWSIRWNLPGGQRSEHTFTLGDDPAPPIVLRAK